MKKAKVRIARFCEEGKTPALEETDLFVKRFIALMRMREDGLDSGPERQTAIWRDVILLSLLNGGIDLVESARLTKDGHSGLTPESMEVVQRNESPKRRKFIFNLNQSSFTTKQFAALVHEKTLELLRSRVSPKLTDPQNAVRSMWVETAVRNGATASVALGCMHPGVKSTTLPGIAIPANTNNGGVIH